MELKRIIVTIMILMVCQITIDAQTRVSAEEISSWCHYLASDSMRGRANGSAQMEAAASWIADRFKQADLNVVPGTDGYIIPYTFSSRRAGEIHERNVMGFIEGYHPTLKNEIILFSAHFDHVGIGRAANGDSIYNGANDNAAGTATLIGLAEAIHRSGIKLNRSLLFLAVSGEEMGMQGSRSFVANPPVDVSNIILDLNFEMTGHCTLLGEYKYYVTGASFTNFDDILDEYNKTSRWARVDTVRNADALFFASDNVSFATRRTEEGIELNIPAFTLCTHGGEDHIHRSNDEPQFMNYKNMASLVNYLLGLITHLDMISRDAIVWDTESFNKFQENRGRR